MRPIAILLAIACPLSAYAAENTGGLGVTSEEIVATCIILCCVLVMSLRSFIPALKPLDKTAIIVTSTILFFITRILDVNDLEEIPWDIILLFAGAISLGFCLWETGAAKWLAVKWLMKLEGANWFLFVMGIAFFVMLLTFAEFDIPGV